MSMVRVIGAIQATKGTPTPILTGTPIVAVSFSISGGIATIVLGPTNLPTNGYNGPDGYPVEPYVPGGYNSNVGKQGVFPSPNGQQVTLWGFTTATYFNGKVVSVISNNPATGAFSFYFNHADVGSTADTGNTAASPFQHYRAVRLECGQSLGSDIIYVGDLNVSASKYMAALSLVGQLAVEIAGDNIPADRIFIDTSGTSSNDIVMCSCIY